MKIIISSLTVLLFYSSICAAQFSESHVKKSELKKFIKLINQNEETIPGPISPDNQKTINRLKKELRLELRTDYLNQLVSQLGDCLQSPCIKKKNNYLTLNLLKKNNICFPDTSCEFYRCMEDKYQCMNYGYEYFEKLAYPTCSNYLKRVDLNKFTVDGIDWIFRVMVCLQKGLVDECDINGNCPVPKDTTQGKKTCDYITEYTLEFHPGCYIDSGIGICQLPLKDQLSIWRTVSPYLTKRERKEAYKVMWHCLSKGGKNNSI